MELLTPDNMASQAVSSQPDLFGITSESRRVLDELIRLSLAYRTTTDFKSLLEFAGRFPSIAPFNAMLLHMQNRGLRYALTPRAWRNAFARSVKPGARAYVVLRIMGPVEFVFDLSDTEPLDPKDNRVPAIADNPFPAKGEPPPKAMENMVAACGKISIVVEEQDFGSNLAGEARRVQSRPYDFIIWLNSKHTRAQKLGTLAHELAHIFCGHLGENKGMWWDSRMGLPTSVMEFEAESVAHIVTTRMALDIGSVEYLSGYLKSGTSDLPNYSLESILTAAGKIETMAAGKFRVKSKNK
jgi:hypothetical protein